MKVKYIESTKHEDIIAELKSKNNQSIKRAHFTNGTYSPAAELIIPTTLAAFKFVVDQDKKAKYIPLIIAVNSDLSMKALGKQDFEPQGVRAAKVAGPMAQLFPKNQIFIVYYDETTPNNLYGALKSKGLTHTLHKWGYGTTPNAPVIEGAENFKSVYAFPLPNDAKPVCYFDTRLPDAPQNIIVKDLRGTYISPDGKVLFSVPKDLKAHCKKMPSLELQAAPVPEHPPVQDGKPKAILPMLKNYKEKSTAQDQKEVAKRTRSRVVCK